MCFLILAFSRHACHLSFNADEGDDQLFNRLYRHKMKVWDVLGVRFNMHLFLWYIYKQLRKILLILHLSLTVFHFH